MKLPGIPLNMERVGEFLLRHGEKILGTVVLLGAAWLAWSGIAAVRTQGVREDHAPAGIKKVAARADAHVGRVKKAPQDFLAAHGALAEQLDAWRSPLPPWQSVAALELADPPPMSLLDKPLFEELAKRTKPDVFPLEELHAAAGVGLFATKPPAGGRDVEPGAAAGSRLAPYVIVTGLIPAGRQQDEYRGRFQGVGYKEIKRDAPLWSDFVLERTAVAPGMPENWEPIDLAAAVQAWARDWAMQPREPPANWLLDATTGDARSPQTTPVAFCGPLPERLDEGWGLDDLHPRLIAWLERRNAADGDRQPEPRSPNAGPGGPGFAGLPPAEAPAAPQPQDPVVESEPYRLFRFIDTDVQSGRAYRYRVRLKVWNPNLGLAPQHLANASLAREQKLASPPSAASNTAVVPGTTRILAGMVRKDDAKRLKIKPGTYEVIVLAPDNSGSDYALRAIYGELGLPADVDAKTGRSSTEIRSRGKPVTTGCILVDARGRQEDRESTTAPRGGTRKPDRELVPEPLEMLCLRPDGSFEFVSAADAERDMRRYWTTLPPIDFTKGDERRPPPEEGQPVPDDPFAAPAAGRRP